MTIKITAANTFDIGPSNDLKKDRIAFTESSKTPVEVEVNGRKGTMYGAVVYFQKDVALEGASSPSPKVQERIQPKVRTQTKSETKGATGLDKVKEKLASLTPEKLQQLAALLG